MSVAETVDVLRRARALIADPETWCQGVGGRRRMADGRLALCAAQAVWKAAGRGGAEVGTPAITALRRTTVPVQRTDYTPLAEWNDAPERTHAEVLAAFDQTIARLEDG